MSGLITAQTRLGKICRENVVAKSAQPRSLCNVGNGVFGGESGGADLIFAIWMREARGDAAIPLGGWSEIPIQPRNYRGLPLTDTVSPEADPNAIASIEIVAKGSVI